MYGHVYIQLRPPQIVNNAQSSPLIHRSNFARRHNTEMLTTIPSYPNAFISLLRHHCLHGAFLLHATNFPGASICISTSSALHAEPMIVSAISAVLGFPLRKMRTVNCCSGISGLHLGCCLRRTLASMAIVSESWKILIMSTMAQFFHPP
jgi:hypothetical protein